MLQTEQRRAHAVELGLSSYCRFLGGWCKYYFKAPSRGGCGRLWFRGGCGQREFELLQYIRQEPLVVTLAWLRSSFKEGETCAFVYVSGDLREKQVFCLKCTELRANPGCSPRKLGHQIVAQGALAV